MFTPYILAIEPPCNSSGRRATGLRTVTCLVFGGLLLLAPPLQAQLSLGGGPVEQSVQEDVEEGLEESVAEQLEEQVEERVLSLGGPPEAIEEVIEETIEESVEESLAENIEESLEESVQETIAETIEEEIVENVEEIVEESVAESLEADIEKDIEQEIEQEISQEIELEVASSVEDAVESSVEGNVEREIDQLLQEIESEIEIDEDRIHKNEWLVMAEPQVFDELAKEGYLFDKVTDLPGIGMRLAEVAAPSSFDITEARQGVMDVVGSGRAKVDLNHIYTAGVTVPSIGDGIVPRDAIRIPADTDELSLRIGMIDSLVDTNHPSLSTSQIENRSFVSAGAELPDFHGTAIASILAANADDYTGLAPNAEIYAAAVFERDNVRGEFASTVSLVLALDWLVSSGVDVVNISLAGPPNSLLEAALQQASKRDVLIVAAAGNGGPMAKPMYPAAYDSVIAVTAVDSEGQVFRLANRGGYLDLAAPGVDLQHAKAGGGYVSSSGTSFAVPFVVTAAARLRVLQPSQDARMLLNASAKDLGPRGRDEIYGYGLLSLEQLPLSASR
jgi:hypothetical protein